MSTTASESLSASGSIPAPIVPSSTASASGSITPSTTIDSHGANQEAMSASGAAHLEELPNGNAESSKMATAVDPTFHALNLASYIFDVGYMQQHWTDVHLTFFSSGLKAHRIILARSPYLAHLMMNTTPGSTIHLSFVDENITQEAVHIAVQHLYKPAQGYVTAINARSVLATAFLLGGMPELVHHAYSICRNSIETINIVDYVQWLGAVPDAYHHANGFRDAGMMYGSVRIQDGQATVQGSSDSGGSWAEDSHPRYGEWTHRLKQDVLEYLIHGLPEQIAKDGKAITSDPRLLTTYNQLPYELFKQCIESPELPIASKQDRFAFAKKIIAQRKKIASAGPAGASQNGTGAPMEESVVLASGRGDEMEVQVTRKPKKGRSFFKVEG